MIIYVVGLLAYDVFQNGPWRGTSFCWCTCFVTWDQPTKWLNLMGKKTLCLVGIPIKGNNNPSCGWTRITVESLTGWCSTLSLLLICSSFSGENGHPLLICSSLSTTQLRNKSGFSVKYRPFYLLWVGPSLRRRGDDSLKSHSHTDNSLP